MSKKRTNGSIVDWSKRRAEIAEAALEMYRDRQWPSIGIEEIAERLGITYWQIYYSFDGLEDIYRAAVGRLLDDVASRVVTSPGSQQSVGRAIQNYVRQTADIVSSETYLRLLYLCLRDGHTEPWLQNAYSKRVAEPLKQGLEDAVTNAGRHLGLEVSILHDARERYLAMLESALALPKLLWNSDFIDQTFEQTVSATAKHIFAATFTFNRLENAEQRRHASGNV